MDNKSDALDQRIHETQDVVNSITDEYNQNKKELSLI